jgi:hypothetical protein
MPGTAAIDALHDGTLIASMQRAGYGLARIHASGVEGLEPWNAADEQAHFEKSLAMLARWDADLEPMLMRLRDLAGATPARHRRAGADADPWCVPIHAAARLSRSLGAGRLRRLQARPSDVRCGQLHVRTCSTCSRRASSSGGAAERGDERS